MGKYRFVLVAIGLIVLAALPARSDDDSVRQALEPLYARMTAAYSARDLRPMLDLLTRDFEARQLDGTVFDVHTFKRFQEYTLTNLEDVKISARITSVEMKDDKAIAIVDNHMEGVSVDDKGVHHQILNNESTRDTWIKVGGGWMIQRTEALEGYVEIDGKRQ